MKKNIFLVVSFCLLTVLGVSSWGDQTSLGKARKIFERLTGTPIPADDPRLKKMTDLLDNGQDEEAAAIATEDPYFYQTTVKNMAATLSNRGETPFVPLDDFQATFIGAVRDGLDARTLLTGNYIYKAKPEAQIVDSPSRRNNKHYDQIDEMSESNTTPSYNQYSSLLVKQEPQWSDIPVHAGLLTTRAWAAAHYSAGTNRRAVQYAFQEFLCLPIDNWKVAGLPDSWVGRDVSRAPGKDPSVYRHQCATCHAGMDAMRGAFANLDFINEGFVGFYGKVAPKYSRNFKVYEDGHVTKDDSFNNLIAKFQPSFGFNPNTLNGHGVNEFGSMLAESQAFKDCMTTKVFTATCNRPPSLKDMPAVKMLANRFGKENYNLKKLFEEVAVMPACVGDMGVKATAGLKNFRQIYYSLRRVFGITPNSLITENYKAIMTRFPKDGRVTEISSPMLLAAQSLGGLFCKQFSNTNPTMSFQQLSTKIYGRDLSKKEADVIDALTSRAAGASEKVFLACTAMTSSIEFLGRK